MPQTQLTAARDNSAYTDRVQPRDILDGRRPVTSPVTTMADAEQTMRYRRLDALPVVDEHGSALGALARALARRTAAAAAEPSPSLFSL